MLLRYIATTARCRRFLHWLAPESFRFPTGRLRRGAEAVHLRTAARPRRADVAVEPGAPSVPASSPLTGGAANVAHVLNLRVDAGVCQRKGIASLLGPRQTPPSSREAARAGFAELVQNHGSGR
jgi:hypothetical protein